MLATPEAAFLIGATPQYLRRLADKQPQMVLPAPKFGHQIDERVAGRLVEFLCRRPLPTATEAYLWRPRSR